MDDLKVGNLDSFASMKGLGTIRFYRNDGLEVVNSCVGAKFDSILLKANRRLKEFDLTFCRINKVETENNRIETLTAWMFSETLKSVRSTFQAK